MNKDLRQFLNKYAATYFAIVLIITFPFYIAHVFAVETPVYGIIANAQLSFGGFAAITVLNGAVAFEQYDTQSLYGIQQVITKGDDQIPFVRRASDGTNIEVILDRDTNGISTNQVWIGTLGQASSCEGTADSRFKCTARVPATGNDTRSGGRYAYDVYYYDDEYLLALQGAQPDPVNAVDTRQAEVFVDNRIPVVNSFSIVQNTSGKFFSYSIADSACDGCQGRCSGFSELKIYKNNAILRTTPVEDLGCSAVNAANIQQSDLDQGLNRFSLSVVDKFGQESAKVNRDVTIDTTAPVINTDSVQILDVNNNVVDFISPRNSSLKLKFTISDEQLDITSVRGNFSSINPSLGIKTATCARSLDRYTCTFVLLINSNTSITSQIPVNASDVNTNLAQATLPFNVQVDSTRPVATSILTNAVQGNQSFLSRGGSIYVNVTETESGLDLKNVYLDLSNLGMGNKVRATSCSSAWSCVWENLSVGNVSGKFFISVSGQSMDDAGNPFTGTLITTVVVDSRAPVVKDLVIIPIRNGTMVPTAATGDKFNITVTVEDANPIRAFANLSRFIESLDAFEGNCTRIGTGSVFGCKFETPPIALSGPYEADLKVTARDFTGNNASISQRVKVLGLDNESNPNYWTHAVTCIPDLLDRQVLPHVEAKVYCRVELISNNAALMNVEKQQCSGENLKSDALIPTNNTRAPLVELVLNSGEYKINSLNITCPFLISSQVGELIKTTPEVENVSIELKFYNMPLGEFDDEASDKIEDARKKAEGIWKIIGFLKQLFKWAENICRILGTIGKVVQAFRIITLSLAIVTEGSGPLRGYFEAVWRPLCATTEGSNTGFEAIDRFSKPFCNFVNCRYTRPQSLSPVSASDGQGGYGNILGNTRTYVNNWRSSVYDVYDSADFVGLDPSAYLDPKHNLILAVVTLCIPGIIYGLDKYRQIECAYGVCLQDAVQNGVPMSACEEQKEYATCKYVMGELFAFLPWTALFDYVMGLVKNALMDPLAALGLVISFVCWGFCTSPEAYSGSMLATPCALAKTFSLVGDIINEIRAIINPDAWTTKDDICKQLVTEEESDEESDDDENSDDSSSSNSGRANQGPRDDSTLARNTVNN